VRVLLMFLLLGGPLSLPALAQAFVDLMNALAFLSQFLVILADLLASLHQLLFELGEVLFLMEFFLAQRFTLGLGVVAPELDLALPVGQVSGELFFLLL